MSVWIYWIVFAHLRLSIYIYQSQYKDRICPNQVLRNKDFRYQQQHRRDD